MIVDEMDRRKRRIDLLLSERLDEAHSQRLANGKYVCLICPSRPIADTLPMLTMHNQGARHQAAVSRLKEKEISKQEEIQKRIALYEPSVTNNDTFNAPVHCTSSFTSPLLKKTRKSTADVLANNMNASGNTSIPKGDQPFVCKMKPFFASLYTNNVKTPDKKTDSPVQHLQVRTDENSNANVNLQSNCKAVSGTVNVQQLDFQKQKEKELKFRAAGWRRDGQGSWFREENLCVGEERRIPHHWAKSCGWVKTLEGRTNHLDHVSHHLSSTILLLRRDLTIQLLVLRGRQGRPYCWLLPLLGESIGLRVVYCWVLLLLRCFICWLCINHLGHVLLASRVDCWDVYSLMRLLLGVRHYIAAILYLLQEVAWVSKAVVKRGTNLGVITLSAGPNSLLNLVAVHSNLHTGLAVY